MTSEDRVYITYGSDGKIRRFDRTGRVIDEWDRPADEPVEPAHVDTDGANFFFGAFIAICMSLVALSLTYVCAQCIAAWLR